MGSGEINLSIPPNQFSIDSVPTVVEPRFFDGNDPDLPRITFENPHTGEKTPEQSAVVKNFCFNGTALLTPAAFDKKCGALNIDTISRANLSGPLLILDLEAGVAYDREKMKELLDRRDIRLKYPEPEFIVLFRTQLMKRVLEVTDEKGVPDYGKLAAVQQNRPGLTREGAVELQSRGFAKVFMVDNISFEVNGAKGFHATQELAAPDAETGKFTPLVYHVGKTEADNFTEENNGKNVSIELGNPPRKGLTGYPVGVYVK